MRLAAIAFLAATAACTTSPASAPITPAPASAEGEAIMKTVDAFLLAIGNGDLAAQASVELPDGMLALARTKDGVFKPVRRIPAGELQKPSADHDPFVEMYWSPKIDVRGPLAHFWAPYELFNNGALVHCGIDAFELVKIDGAWKIHSAVSSLEPGSCAELGAANGAPRRPRDGWKETPNN